MGDKLLLIACIYTVTLFGLAFARLFDTHTIDFGFIITCVAGVIAAINVAWRYSLRSKHE